MKNNKSKYFVSNTIYFIFICLLTINNLISQVPGEWTWMKGNTGLNTIGVYGTKGVSNPTNEPPSEYEAPEWTDNLGNFWMYGGTNNVVSFSDNMWKYDPTINQWTWMHGSANTSSLSSPVYGTRGVASISNTPGFRTTGYTWVDKNNKLWLFGGFGYAGPATAGAYNDMWKYDPLTNMWTWMKGPQGGAIPGNYGLKGIEDTINNPNPQTEMGVSWTDDVNGDLWLVDGKGCLWKYRMATNNWIWIHGNNITNANSVYGIKGVASANNTPGSTFYDFTRWKDSKGDFWYLYSRGAPLKVLWKYNISSNMWTWIWGDTISTNFSNYGSSYCDINNLNIEPKQRNETRACWIDACDNLWMFGGASSTATSNPILNDLVFYSTSMNEWIWADNSTTQVTTSNYGTQGVSASANMPSSRHGAMPFTDNSGNFWFFGGRDHTNQMKADLWRYMPDTSCTKCNSLVTSIKSIDINKEIVVAPNPSTSLFKIISPLLIDEVIVVDHFGNLIKQEFFENKKQIEISISIEGIYFLQIKSGNKKTIRKVIVAK